MTEYKYRLPWHCPECKQRGNVWFNDGVDMWCIMDKIAQNHHKISPECELWWSFIKIGETNDTVSNPNESNTG